MPMAIKLIAQPERGGKIRSGWLILGYVGATNLFISENNVHYDDEVIKRTFGRIQATIRISASVYREYRTKCGVPDDYDCHL